MDVPKIEWREDLSVGIKAIDDDHRQLIRIINDLFEEVESDADKTVLEHYFEELESYTHYHFEREEKLMKARCASEVYEEQIGRHLEQHRYFVGKIPALKTRLLGTDSKAVSLEILDFLLHWLIDHIIYEDLLLTQCFIGPLAKEKHHGILDRSSVWFAARFPFSTRVFLLVFIPLLILAGVSGYLGWQTYRQYHYLDEVQNVSSAFVGLNRLINALQRERGLGTGYLASKGSRFKAALCKQRAETDAVLEGCRIDLERLDGNKIGCLSLFEQLDSLDEVREEIDNREISVEANIDYYSLLIEHIIEIIKKSGYRYFYNAEENAHAPLLMLMYLKENEGLIRSEGALLLSSGSVSRDLGKFDHLLILGEAYFKSTQLLASQELLAKLLALENSPAAEEVARMQDAIRSGKVDFSADKWFAEMSEHIDAYEKLIERILDRVQKRATALKSHELAVLIVMAVLLLLIVAVTILFSYVLRESILRPIVSVTDALRRLSRGEKVFTPIRYRQDDPIGEMITAYNMLRQSLIKADFAAMLLEMQEKKAMKYAEMAFLDPLTGLLNRRKYSEILFQEFVKAKTGETVCLLMLDLDRFKQVNDTYGHDTGDKVLQMFAHTVKRTVRSEDLFARIGGEEFALVVTGTSKDSVMKIAQKILKTVEEMDLSGIRSDLHLTVSIGVACSDEGFETLDAMIKRADHRLYEAKRAGRNRVRG